MLTTLDLGAPAVNEAYIDTCMFQSGSSLIVPYDAQADPRAALCFAEVATLFCSGASLRYPIPRTDSGKLPFLLELWKPYGALPVANAELKDKELEWYEAPLEHGFVEYVEQYSDEVARWLRFQYTPSIMNEYFARAGRDPIQRVLPNAAKFLLDRSIPNFCQAIDTHIGNTIPTVFRSDEAFKGKPQLFATAYLFSVYIRGLSYAQQCGQTNTTMPYSFIWFRKNALQRPTKQQASRYLRTCNYPWGIVLACLWQGGKDGMVRNSSHIAELLQGIREQSDPFHRDLHSISAKPESGVNDDKINRLVVKTLLAAGLQLRHRPFDGGERRLMTLLHVLAIISGEKAFEAAVTLHVLLELLKPEIDRFEAGARLALNFGARNLWFELENNPQLMHGIQQATAQWRASLT